MNQHKQQDIDCLIADTQSLTAKLHQAYTNPENGIHKRGGKVALEGKVPNPVRREKKY